MSRPTLGKLLIVVLIQAATFSYFSQGGGYNQAATLGEIRAIAEEGHFHIGDYAAITGDASFYKGRIYSNKHPSVTFFAAPPYFLFYRGARLAGIDTGSDSYQFLATHVITFLCAGVWGALVGLLLFFLLGELFASLSENQRVFLSLMFPLSTLLLPYSTMAFVHAFETFWFLLTSYLLARYIGRPARGGSAALLGLSYGVALLANPLFAATAPALYWALLAGGGSRWRRALIFSLAAAAPLIPLLIYNLVNFDNPFLANRNFQSPAFTDHDTLLGVFTAPRPERLLHVLFYGCRSLSPTQAYLLFFIPGLFFIIRDKMLPGAVMAYFSLAVCSLFLFIASFNGWNGGVCFGPRYLTPILPVFLIWSVPIYRRLKKVYTALIFLSFAMMLIVTSVDALRCGDVLQFPFPFTGHSLPNFARGNIAINPDKLFPSETALDFSYNLGQIMGLSGLWSLIPLLAFQGAAGFLLYRLCAATGKSARGHGEMPPAPHPRHGASHFSS